MPSSQAEQKRIETYAQVLLETSRKQGRTAQDLEILKAATTMPAEILSLLQVMSENGDLQKLSRVCEVFEELVREDKCVVCATITSAVPLSSELKEQIIAKLTADMNSEIYLIEKVDPSIMGGFIITVGDERRDVSVKTQLESVRAALSDVIQAGGDK